MQGNFIEIDGQLLSKPRYARKRKCFCRDIAAEKGSSSWSSFQTGWWIGVFEMVAFWWSVLSNFQMVVYPSWLIYSHGCMFFFFLVNGSSQDYISKYTVRLHSALQRSTSTQWFTLVTRCFINPQHGSQAEAEDNIYSTDLQYKPNNMAPKQKLKIEHWSRYAQKG